jgi:transcription initiation factor IIF auxiliary subunit
MPSTESIEIRQWERYDGDDWWTWAVWIDGPDEALDEVEFVEWKLHPTFPKPVRKTEDRQSKFRLETGGWGTFPIIARVQMSDGSQLKLKHDLELIYPDDSPAPT